MQPWLQGIRIGCRPCNERHGRNLNCVYESEAAGARSVCGSPFACQLNSDAAPCWIQVRSCDSHLHSPQS